MNGHACADEIMGCSVGFFMTKVMTGYDLA